MLYNSNWDAKTKPDIYALSTLIAWLEKQPSDEEYCFTDNRDCLLSQYLYAAGFDNVCVYTDGFLHGPREKYNPGLNCCRESLVHFPRHFNGIAIQRPRTFGAALDRARKLQQQGA